MKLKRTDKRKRQEEPGSPQRSKFTKACSGTTTSKAEKSCFSVEIPGKRFMKTRLLS